MILVDTSVWIDHLRAKDDDLVELLHRDQVLIHPFVLGELALGNLNNRAAVLNSLREMPRTPVATNDEVLHFIDQSNLYGIGIGYIDAHLLAAVRLLPGTMLWTRDRRLLAAGQRLGMISSVH